MNKKVDNPDSLYTQNVKSLIDKVHPQEAGYGSVLEDARHFFSLQEETAKYIRDIESQIARLKARDSDKAIPVDLQKKLKRAKARSEEERQARITRITSIAKDLLALCEADSYEETQLLSAKFLGTVMLLTRGAQRNFARHHQRLKPLYKAVLTLRLVDRIIREDAISHPYLSLYRDSANRFQNNDYWRRKWEEELAIPLISAAILQDIGLQHPEAQLVLLGEEKDKDEFRLLDADDRKKLLRLNYTHTMNYLKNGLGMPAYVGNDREERHRYNKMHEAANQFREKLVQDAFLSKTGLGEILKVPQVYCSVVLSTKSDYSRQELPKGYLLVEQLGKKGAVNKKVADAFTQIVGYFPQGFGVTFIPVNEQGYEKEQFEFAIVSRLNPTHPAEPVCRVASRNLTYICSGSDEVVSRTRNLYFPANRKKLIKMGRDRLQQIIRQLNPNAAPNAVDDLVPGFWEPSDYFSDKKNQNMWNKT
ncbi:hypothetical protein [Salinimonas chungwhensis]|uniref:hypothetical protein n=1 Tax=Salinimonas chungwhensis TaxID=265425 RepID=UPI00035D919E|nr:hypothetical protein [Salinimonas chungwhensis]